MNDVFDPFKLSDGLPLADVDAEISAVEFRFDTAYSADACVAAITFQPDEGDEQEQLYSCGKNWEPVDRGAATAHENGKPTQMFNKSSNMGRFLNALYACDGFIAAVQEEGDFDPRTAASLVGRRVHLGSETYTTMNPSTGVEKERSIIVPTEYLGTSDDATTPAKAPAKKAAAKKAPAKGPSAVEKKQLALIEALREEDGGEEIIDALTDLAGESEDHESFMEAAMDVDGVADSEAAQQVAMSSKAGSIWAQAQG